MTFDTLIQIKYTYFKETALQALESRDLESFVEAVSEPDFDVEKESI